jgi:CDP-paratose 2-epimerase
LEYGHTYRFPVWVNRCGVLAGAGQFGTAEQGIFSFWLHAHSQRRPLGFFGFGGRGLQVRDALHPNDLATLVIRQISDTGSVKTGQILHVAGGSSNAMSLAQLTAWCDQRFGPHPAVSHAVTRPFDVPWVVLDPTRARQVFGWVPEITLPAILDEIATHAETHPDWLNMTGG